MQNALLFARLALAVTFVTAAVTKTFDFAGTREAVVGFGLPRVLSTPIAVVLPVVELAAAALLVRHGTASAGGWVSIALLAAFSTAIAVSLARGRQPECHCFGQISSAPIGGRTLARNALLAAVAVFIVVTGPSRDGGVSIGGWWTDLSGGAQLAAIALAVAGVVLVGETWFLIGLFRQHGRVLLRLDDLEARVGGAPGLAAVPSGAGLAVGSPAPDFALPGLHGETLTLGALRAEGAPIALLFTDPACRPCQTLMPDIAQWQRDFAGKLSIALVSRGTQEANLAKIREHGVRSVLLQKDQEVANAYRYNGTPGAVIVGADGNIASPVVAGPDAVRDLIRGAAGAPAMAGGNGHVHQHHHAEPASALGQPAPAFELPTLEGGKVSLDDLKGRDTVVVFWNPDCGFCQQLLPDVQAYEASPPPGTPDLVFISTGDVDKNRALGLRAPVLLDASFSVGPRYGANGTPMAVRIDAEGRVASAVAVGGPDVMALAASSVG